MIRDLLGTLRGDARGSMAIETAFVAPVLILLALGTVDLGILVSQQQQLQSAALEAEGIVMGTLDPATMSDSTIEDVLETSLGLNDNQLVLSRAYRCDDQTLSTTKGGCGTNEQEYEYIQLTLNDSYAPTWTHLGLGTPSQFTVTRTVQIQ
ncbi:TadE/TadG family type IV pilus assembly protein [Erythrobacter litoralis]|uniref:TadE-like domain-containing protein n=1 Tax=Erythrobacter litoralis (strain HTCC2594) TaxID=314225 RepID=Q2NAC4_ERYLH|nr:TadE/TadG family type IV pilus assembly protein [Erythrobacter litoralis]ABC63367.1 hypothetical protein ELI_06375 [Erythrobacter litoralis HTCC2594]